MQDKYISLDPTVADS